MDLSLLIGVVIVLSDTNQSTATKVVLGGELFSSTSMGESGGYLMTDFKSKVFELIIKYAIPISLPSSFPKPACPVIVSLYGFLWKWVKPLIIINLRRMAGHIFTNYGKIQTIEWILGAQV